MDKKMFEKGMDMIRKAVECKEEIVLRPGDSFMKDGAECRLISKRVADSLGLTETDMYFHYIKDAKPHYYNGNINFAGTKRWALGCITGMNGEKITGVRDC